MRCYFMRGGHIAAVEVLDQASDDDAAVSQARALYAARLQERFEGFEVWEQARLIFRYPEDGQTNPAP